MTQLSIPSGRHIILDLHQCECDPLLLSHLLSKANYDFLSAVESLVTVLGLNSHQFLVDEKEHGWSYVALLSESHVSCHTWPTEGFAALDTFTCGTEDFLDQAAELAIAHFKPKHVSRQDIKRGILPHAVQATS